MVMTNKQQCTQHGIFCEHIPYWSNPNITHPTLGMPMGVPGGTTTNCYMGSDAPVPCDADNAQVLNLNANTAANFRQGAPPLAEILLVNDEAGASPGVVDRYTQALALLSRTYAIHPTGASGDDEPTALDLAPYQKVIWFTGLSRISTTGPSAAGEAALSAWLSQGGCLLLSSQDYAYAHNSQPTAFMQQYLGVQSIIPDSAYPSVTGSGPFSGLGPYNLNPPPGFPEIWNWSDAFQPAPGALMAFTSSLGSTAVFNLSRSFRTTYLGFPLEALTAPADQAAVLRRFLDTCQFWGAFMPMLARP
jgi:hypothetical protein